MEKFDLSLYEAVAALWRDREADYVEADDPTAAAWPDTVQSLAKHKLGSFLAACRFLVHAAGQESCTVRGIRKGEGTHADIPKDDWHTLRLLDPHIVWPKDPSKCKVTAGLRQIQGVKPEIVDENTWRNLLFYQAEIDKLRPEFRRLMGITSPGLRPTTIKKWIEELMAAGPKTKKRDKYYEEAKSEFPKLSDRSFKSAWKNCMETNPDWCTAGRLPGNRRGDSNR